MLIHVVTVVFPVVVNILLDDTAVVLAVVVVFLINDVVIFAVVAVEKLSCQDHFCSFGGNSV